MAKVRLGEKDRPDYERGDEWFDFDLTLDWTDDIPWDVLDEIEQVFAGESVFLLKFYSARHLRVAMFIARRRAGIVEKFGRFKPHPYNYEWDAPEVEAADPEPADAGDADPPVPSSADPTLEASVSGD